MLHAMDALRSRIATEVILPADPAYDEARATFNATIDRRPAAICRPRTTADVVAAVRWAREAGLPMAVRGGGHSVAGHSVGEASLVIDLRLMRDVHVDVAARRVRVGGGALWEDVDGATTPHGLATPGGTFGDTGVGGLTLGGGLGWLLGTAGLTCDNLVRAEVVSADGSVVIAGPDGAPDLLWALRGGGGNFGVVTEFEFRLHPVGMLYAGSLRVPLAAAAEAMEAARALALVCPPELSIMGGGPVYRGDELDVAPGPAAEPRFSLTVVYQGSAEDAENAIRPLRRLPIVDDTVAPMTYMAAQEMSGRLPFGLRHYWKGHFVRDLDAGAIGSVVNAMGAAKAFSFVLMEGLTGAAREEPEGGAAFGQRAARWNVTGLGIWEATADDGAQTAWARDLAGGLTRSSLSGAGYANYSSADETAERVKAAFGEKRFARLAAVKRRYDPDNVFRFNLNVPPAAD